MALPQLSPTAHPDSAQVEVKILRSVTAHDLETHRADGWQYKHIQFTDDGAKLNVVMERTAPDPPEPEAEDEDTIPVPIPAAYRRPFAAGYHSPATGTLTKLVDQTPLPRPGTVERKQYDAQTTAIINPADDPPIVQDYTAHLRATITAPVSPFRTRSTVDYVKETWRDLFGERESTPERDADIIRRVEAFMTDPRNNPPPTAQDAHEYAVIHGRQTYKTAQEFTRSRIK